MKKINTRRAYYLLRHKYLTLNNVVVTIALIIAASWVWGSLGVMQRNYTLQKEVNYKSRELQLAELETRRLELENRYYQTREYQEIAVRRSLGLGMPGESVLILPENSIKAKAVDTTNQTAIEIPIENQSNWEQWMNFLFGAKSGS